MPDFIDETGNRYGRLTVEARVGTCHTGALWLCRCDCGKTRVASGSYLRTGKAKECEDCRKARRKTPILKPGMVYHGREIIKQLTVEPRKVHEKWLVRCTHCGREYGILMGSLMESERCNVCYGKSEVIDEKGKRHGMLTVIEQAEAPYGLDPHKAYWLCECDCGTRIVAEGYSMRAGKIFSCGCTYRTAKWKREQQDEKRREGHSDGVPCRGDEGL